MNKPNIRRASLDEIEEMERRGELYHDPNAPVGPPPGEDLPPGFWEEAELINFNEPKSVHLKLDPDVFLWFKSQGKGHITRMQNVLKAYVNAQKKRAGKQD